MGDRGAGGCDRGAAGQGGAAGAADLAEQREFLVPAVDGWPAGAAGTAEGQATARGREAPKQPGAPGSFLAWSQHPDERVQGFPGGACACGPALAGAADLGVTASHQQGEIL